MYGAFTSIVPYVPYFRASEVPYVKVWYGIVPVRYRTIPYRPGNAVERPYEVTIMLGAKRRVKKRCDYDGASRLVILL